MVPNYQHSATPLVPGSFHTHMQGKIKDSTGSAGLKRLAALCIIWTDQQFTWSRQKITFLVNSWPRQF